MGRAPGPATLVVLVGTFRSAATWAAGEGLHLSQWTLVEACSPLMVFDRRYPRPSKEDVGLTVRLASAGIKDQTRRDTSRWWRPDRRRVKKTPSVGPQKGDANYAEEGVDHGRA